MEPHTQLRDPVTNSDNPPPPRKLNGLVPTLSTVSFFNQASYNFSHKEQLLDLSSLAVDLYIYGTGANPRQSNFHEKGGKCYIVAVWRGRVTYSDGGLGSGGITFKFKTWGGYPASNRTNFMDAAEIEPTGHISEDTQQMYQYELQFKKTMPMFSDEGASPYEFTATYEDRFSNNNKQSGYPADMVLISEILPETKTLDISGLTVHRLACAEPVMFTTECSFEIGDRISIRAWADRIIDLSFPVNITDLVSLPTVSFFKQQSITFSDVDDQHINLKSVVVDLYIHGTRANPQEPDVETKGGTCYIVAVWRGYFLPEASAKITNVKFKTYGGDLMSSPMWTHPGDVEPRHFSLGGPETNVYEYDIGSKKTMQMFSNGDQAHDKFNAAYVDRFERILPQMGYTEDHWNKIVLEMRASLDSRTKVFGLTVHKLSGTSLVDFTTECGFERTVPTRDTYSLVANTEVDLRYPS